MENKYRITWGIHRGTIWSRDDGDPMEFETEQEAMDWHKQNETHFNSMGYKIWYAYLSNPDGTKKLLASNCNYD